MTCGTGRSLADGTYTIRNSARSGALLCLHLQLSYACKSPGLIQPSWATRSGLRPDAARSNVSLPLSSHNELWSGQASCMLAAELLLNNLLSCSL